MDKANRTYFSTHGLFTTIYRLIKVLADGHHRDGDEAEGAATTGLSMDINDTIALRSSRA
jgi:hypothetical protein